jgi:hypothetical protein
MHGALHAVAEQENMEQCINFSTNGITVVQIFFFSFFFFFPFETLWFWGQPGNK